MKRKRVFMMAAIVLMLLSFSSISNAQEKGDTVKITVSSDNPGVLMQWHKVTLEIDGPSASETDSNNPFLYYKLTGVFTQGSLTYTVPGYFAADGDAAETSASSGDQWRVHFCPPTSGTWNYTIRFRYGTNVAINSSITAGSAVDGLDNITGSFSVSETTATGRDMRAKGRLEYVGEHFLQFAGTGEYFLKAGPDSPEGFLSYEDFDNTPDISGLRKTWEPHAGDWNAGDPRWQSGKGTEIIGALNYLASEGLNTFSFLTMNIGGDDKNVYPYISTTDLTRFDCSKLGQWAIVFEHAQSLGLHTNFKLMEQENDKLLDRGATGTERKVYLRELIARFGHMNALTWNCGEETRLSTSQIQDMSQYIYDTDPYHSNIVIHTFIGAQDDIYTPLLGNNSKLTGVSVQVDWDDVHDETQTWVDNSADVGRKWVVANDEQGPSNKGVPSDDSGINPKPKDIRHQTLWGNIMAGGAGVEYYFGAPSGENDMKCQDYRTRDKSWDYCRFALEFFNDNNIPFWEMSNADDLSSDGDDYVLAKTGDGAVYVIYLPNGGSTNINLSGASGHLEVKWYNPRNGGSLQDGSVISVTGGGTVSTGTPPSSTTSDWVVLVRPMTPPPEADPVEDHNVADISGNNHNIIFHRSEGPIDTNLRPIVMSTF